MDMLVSFAGGKKVYADYKGFTIKTDQTSHLIFMDIWENCQSDNVDIACVEIDYQNKGLTINISNTTQRKWIMNHSTGIAELSGKHNDDQIEVCAPCHSHRSKIDDQLNPENLF